MAKVYFDADIEGISGRLSKKTNGAYAMNKKTGKCYRYEYNTDSKVTNTTDQQTVRSTFKAKAQAAATLWNENKPTKERTEGTTLYQDLMKAYDAQRKYGNPFVYLRSLISDDMKLVIGGQTYTVSGSSASEGGSGTGNNEEEV